MLVAVVVAVAAVCLLLGLVSGPFELVWVALGLSLAGLLLMTGLILWSRRAGRAEGHTVGATGDAARTTEPKSTAGSATESAAESAGDESDVDTSEDRDSTTAEVEPAPGSGSLAVSSSAEADEALVLVLPGRRRFHRSGCELVAGRRSEEITLGEAIEEGFSPCTKCVSSQAALGNAG